MNENRHKNEEKSYFFSQRMLFIKFCSQYSRICSNVYVRREIRARMHSSM